MNNNQKPEEQFNVIPQMNPVDNGKSEDIHQFDNAFVNNVVNNNQSANQTQNTFVAIPVYLEQKNELDDINQVIKPSQNRFINDNIDTTTNSLNNLNIENGYNNGPKIDYSKDPKVIENLQKRNTVSITSEGKVFIVIIIALLIFIFVLPTVFEYIRGIQYQ